MNIQFQIEYRTQWGEELRVQLWTVSKGDIKQAVDELTLSTSDGLMWTGDMHLDIQQPPQGDTIAFEYQYAMWREGSLVWTEWEVAPHRVALDGITDRMLAQILSFAAKRNIGIEAHWPTMHDGGENGKIAPYSARFLRIAREVGCAFTLGSDSHSPTHLAARTGQMRDLARQAGITDELMMDI